MAAQRRWPALTETMARAPSTRLITADVSARTSDMKRSLPSSENHALPTSAAKPLTAPAGKPWLQPNGRASNFLAGMLLHCTMRVNPFFSEFESPVRAHRAAATRWPRGQKSAGKRIALLSPRFWGMVKPTIRRPPTRTRRARRRGGSSWAAGQLWKLHRDRYPQSHSD